MTKIQGSQFHLYTEVFHLSIQKKIEKIKKQIKEAYRVFDYDIIGFRNTLVQSME